MSIWIASTFKIKYIILAKSVNDPAQGVTEIDESKSGEAWVQGLSEGEYCGLYVEDRLSALVAIISVANEGNIVRAVLEDRLDLYGMNYERNLVVQNTFMSRTTPTVQHNGSTSERSRLQLKFFIGHRAEEMHVYRSLPLGQDRRHNHYWQFVASASRHDPGSGRIFVELCDGGWRMIDSEEAHGTDPQLYS